MERGISVRRTEIIGPVKVDHLQSWSQTFRSDQTEMVRSIWCTDRNFRNFGFSGTRSLTNNTRLLYCDNKWFVTCQRHFDSSYPITSPLNWQTTTCNNMTTQLTSQVNNQSLISTTGVIQLTLTLKMTIHRLSKYQLQSTTVLFRATLTRTIVTMPGRSCSSCLWCYKPWYTPTSCLLNLRGLAIITQGGVFLGILGGGVPPPPPVLQILTLFQTKKCQFSHPSSDQGPVVRSPISVNPGVNFNLGSFFFWSTAFPQVVFSILFRVSYHQVVDEKN